MKKWFEITILISNHISADNPKTVTASRQRDSQLLQALPITSNSSGPEGSFIEQTQIPVLICFSFFRMEAFVTDHADM